MPLPRQPAERLSLPTPEEYPQPQAQAPLLLTPRGGTRRADGPSVPSSMLPPVSGRRATGGAAGAGAPGAGAGSGSSSGGHLASFLPPSRR